MQGRRKVVILLTYLSLSFTLVNCGRPIREVGDFEGYVEKFETYSKEQGKELHVTNLIIREDKLDDSQLGVCKQGAGTPEIIINSEYWKDLDETNKEVLLMHEMGHCVLNRGHKNDPVEGRECASIMIQWTQKVEDYFAHKEDYLHELFHPS